MLLKALFLVLVALAVGSPVPAVGQRKLLAEVDKYDSKFGSAWSSNYDETTSTYTYVSLSVYQYANGIDYWYLYIYVQNDSTGEYASAYCSETLPGAHTGIFRTQFGNCWTEGANPPPSPLNGCTQFSARLKGQPNQQDRCNNKEFYNYYDYNTKETYFIRYNLKSKHMQVSGTVEGVDCTFTVSMSGGDIYEYVWVQKWGTKKD